MGYLNTAGVRAEATDVYAISEPAFHVRMIRWSGWKNNDWIPRCLSDLAAICVKLRRCARALQQSSLHSYAILSDGWAERSHSGVRPRSPLARANAAPAVKRETGRR
jgi:hypothetical protein